MKRRNEPFSIAVVLLTVCMLTASGFGQSGNNSRVNAKKNQGAMMNSSGTDQMCDRSVDRNADGQGPDGMIQNPERGNRRGFIDVDGDGLNDLAQDFDGDGIANGKDPDYVRPQDGTGRQLGLRSLFRGSGGCGSGTGRSSMVRGMGRGAGRRGSSGRQGRG